MLYCKAYQKISNPDVVTAEFLHGPTNQPKILIFSWEHLSINVLINICAEVAASLLV